MIQIDDIIQITRNVDSYHPYINKTFSVRSIDEATGHIDLYDVEAQQSAMFNFIKGAKGGYKIKIVSKSKITQGSPEDSKQTVETPMKEIIEMTDSTDTPVKKTRKRRTTLKVDGKLGKLAVRRAEGLFVSEGESAFSSGDKVLVTVMEGGEAIQLVGDDVSEVWPKATPSRKRRKKEEVVEAAPQAEESVEDSLDDLDAELDSLGVEEEDDLSDLDAELDDLEEE